MTISLNSLSGKLLTSISLKFFFVSSFCLTLSVFNSMYYVKQESYLSQLEGVVTGRLGCVQAAVSWGLQIAKNGLSGSFIPVGPRNTSLLGTKARCSRDVPCVDCAHLLGFVCQDNRGMQRWDKWLQYAGRVQKCTCKGQTCKVEVECENGSCQHL